MTDYSKPLPSLDPVNRPFWEATRRGELCLQQCQKCLHIRYPINAVCPRCLAEEAQWVALSGKGEVYSSIVFHQVYHKAFEKDVPYNVALIQLVEGPRMISNVVGVPPHEVKVGDRVEVTFEPVTAEVTIPRFRRVAVE